VTLITIALFIQIIIIPDNNNPVNYSNLPRSNAVNQWIIMDDALFFNRWFLTPGHEFVLSDYLSFDRG
jgi:hypothetical protein